MGGADPDLLTRRLSIAVSHPASTPASARQRDREPVDIELLFVAGCPHATRALADIDRVVKQTSVPADIAFHRIAGPDDALRARFLGSPSVRVAGRDIEPGADARTDYGIKCRLYREGTRACGTPPPRWLHEALGVR